MKSVPIFIKCCPKSSHSSFYLKVTFFEVAKEVTKYLGYFCYKLCHLDIPKIAQSGHTGHNRKREDDVKTWKNEAQISWRITLRASVTRLGYFWMVEVTDFLTTEAQVSGDFWGYSLNGKLYLRCVILFGQLFAKIFLFHHLVTLFLAYDYILPVTFYLCLLDRWS